MKTEEHTQLLNLTSNIETLHGAFAKIDQLLFCIALREQT